MTAMLKFTCEHCGHRIATPQRRLGQLVTCPECDRPTHPLAGQILQNRQPAASPSAPSASVSTPLPERACDNCGRAIGRLQKLHLWENNVVCAACHQTLAGEVSRGERTAAAVPTSGTQAQALIERVAVHRREAGGGELVPTGRSARPVAPAAGSPVSAVPAAALRAMPLTVRGRAMVVLVAFCVAAAAVYGALSLLRDLAGIIAALAFIALALVVVLLVVRASVSAGKRFVTDRFGGAKAGASGATATTPKLTGRSE